MPEAEVDDITGEDVNLMRILYGITNALFIITFVTQQFASQQGPSDEELEPDTDDDGIDTGSEDDSDEEFLDDGEITNA